MADVVAEELAPGAAATLNAHRWERAAENFYTEPHWCSERLFALERFSGEIVDPACGSGRILEAAAGAGHAFRGFDIVRRALFCGAVEDFLSPEWNGGRKVDNIVSNPPYGDDLERFVRLALERTRFKVALLLAATWHCADERAEWLETTPLLRVRFLTPRPSIPPGEHVLAGGLVGGGRINFAWFVWSHDHAGPPGFAFCRRGPKPKKSRKGA